MPNPWDKPTSVSPSNPWDKPGTVTSTPSMWETIKSGATDVAKGLGETLAQNVASVNGALGKIPLVGQVIAPKAGVDAYQELARPVNTTQKVGKALGDIGENVALTALAPEAEAGQVLPLLGRIGPKAAGALRIGTQGVTQGAISGLQGGSAKDMALGAGLGTVGGTLGEGLRALAPTVAESALNVRGADRSYGAKPGEAILKYTKGVRPSTIEDSAQDALNTAKDNQRNIASLSSQPVDLRFASDEALKQEQTLRDQLFRSPEADLVKERLVTPFTTLPSVQVPAEQALDIRTGIGSLGKWNELAPGQQALSSASKPVYRQVADAIHALPGVGDKIEAQDKIIHSLIPAVERSNAADLNAGFLQQAFHRFRVPTGALTGAVGGASYGNHEGGLPGALVGGAAGLLLGPGLTNPTSMMVMARAMNKAPKAVAPIASLLGTINRENQ